MACEGGSGIELESLGGGVWAAPNARIIDRTGRKRVPIGDDGFVSAMGRGALVDKTMLIVDVLKSSSKVTLFCRPRRFGKTLNMTMLKAFLQSPEDGGLSSERAEEVFGGTEVWEADGGRWRESRGAWPVVYLSFNTVKKLSWEASLGEIRGLVETEYSRHSQLATSDAILSSDRELYARVVKGNESDSDLARSLSSLCRMLSDHHGTGVVVLIDEYDAPVMAGYTNGYYDEVVGFLKGWLTGALKDGGEALAFACLTGVQRISKESIFSDLNNMRSYTPLDSEFDERWGFSDAEVEALATYLGHPDCMPEARKWYDGYRFGRADVYNPWSVLNYLDSGCEADIYWGNTSGNSVLGELVAGADEATLADVYALLEPDGKGVVWEPLDLGLVFPDVGVRRGSLWSMLYLAGYLTTEDTQRPNTTTIERALRIPDLEIAELYRAEVIERFVSRAGGRERLRAFQRALVSGDETVFGAELSRVARDSASYHDLASEAACHMLVMGLMFGTGGYLDPVSNREAGYGRDDIRMEPDPRYRGRFAKGPRPLVTVEVKFLAQSDRPEGSEELAAALDELAAEAVEQVSAGAYDAKLSPAASGRVRWGIAFAGKRVAVACERPER